MKTMNKYAVSHQATADGCYQSITIEAPTEEIAIAYFKELKPSHICHGAAPEYSTAPGKPCVTVPDGWTPAEETAAEPFPLLAEEIRNEYETRRNDVAIYVESGFFPHWSEENRNDPDRGLKQYSTAIRWEAYKAGTLSREKAVELATRRAVREVNKSEAKQGEKMRAAANAPALVWCQIAVEWVKNSYWGNNPHATATANNATTYGRASGCGYDKQSAAIAEALNANPAALRMLYEAAEKALQEGKQPTRKGLAAGCVSWWDILGYGSGYSLLPYFEGGCGVSCFGEIFSRCGYAFRCGASSRHFDSYTVSRAEV